jgi:hypothetical protein
MANNFFICVLSNREFKIDKEEVPAIIDAVNKGVTKVCKQGVMNPSYFVGIVADTKREEIDYIQETDEYGAYTGKRTPKKLQDLFIDMREEIRMRIESNDDKKFLKSGK